MKVTSHNFKENAHAALEDENIQIAMGLVKKGFVVARKNTAAKLPEFESLRDQGVEIKNRVLENLDFYLEKFEEKVIAEGGHVHWCSTPGQARETILKICQDADAKTVTKGKSMITEEIGLNDFLDSHGIEPIETDLGEYIIQLAGEAPSHIIGKSVV